MHVGNIISIDLRRQRRALHIRIKMTRIVSPLPPKWKKPRSKHVDGAARISLYLSEPAETLREPL